MTKGMLEGNVAIITGASSGIGRAAASVFARYGAKVVLADINEKDGEAAAGRVREEGGDALFVATDVSRASDVEALVARTVERYGRLDCAFNNAGIDGTIGTIAECTEENWDRTLAVNLKGVFLCMKYEIQAMLKQGGGAIVNTASVAGLVGLASIPAYVVSKHGVVGLTKAAALEWSQRGIRVNALCPGAIRTPLLESAFQQGVLSEAGMIAAHPIGRLGSTDEVAEAAAWLCSEKASFVTGLAMPTDGGYVAI